SLYYIKRIIGLPGEKIEINNGEIVVFNDKHQDGVVFCENYLPFGLDTTGKEGSVVISPDEYFVLGDNRNFSFDSRSWGALQKNELVGLVRLRLWPPNEVMAFEKPAY
ncbi:MAG: signal peptidase I, partial [Patescibacteria group bacterium]